MIRFVLPALALLCGGGPTAAQPSSEQATIDAAMRRAHLMYWYDQAALHGTDDMLAKGKHVASRIGGWIVDGPAGEPLLIFYSKGGDPAPVYFARFQNGRLAEDRVPRHDERSLISPTRRPLVAVARSESPRCSDRRVWSDRANGTPHSKGLSAR